MKNITMLSLAGVLAVAAPVFAQSQNDENIKADVQALDKDNASLQKDQNKLAQDRAAKAQDKSDGSYGKQAVDSVKIGADKAAIDEKDAEKDVDKSILKHHKEEASSDNGDPQTATTPKENP